MSSRSYGQKTQERSLNSVSQNFHFLERSIRDPRTVRMKAPAGPSLVSATLDEQVLRLLFEA